MEREFLGWERPFCEEVVDWLWARRDELPGMILVVPTSQSGRRVRESLAEKAGDGGGLLTPRVVTSSFFLEGDSDSAGQLVERVAWVEVLEEVLDWEEYGEVFPVAPGEDEEKGWALPLAKSLASLRWQLAEAGLTLAMAAGRLKETIEAGRWADLAKLEKKVEEKLRGWKLLSRNRALVDGDFSLPVTVQKIVVAGVTDAGALVMKRWRELNEGGTPVTFLIAGHEEDGFDEFGRPISKRWIERVIPAERTHLALDARGQADLAVELLDGCDSLEVSLGVCG